MLMVDFCMCCFSTDWISISAVPFPDHYGIAPVETRR